MGGDQTSNGQGQSIDQCDAKWSSLSPSRQTSPWPYAKGELFRTIASLELLGTLLVMLLLIDGDEDASLRSTARVSVGGLTDNTGHLSRSPDP